MSIDFERPSFSDDPHVERLVSACPASSVTRGTFFQGICHRVRAQHGSVPDRLFAQLSRKSWMPFGSYPLREFMRLSVAAAQILYPTAPLSDGLRRVGQGAFERLVDTMAGRVIVYAFGERIQDVMMAAPKAYAHVLPGSSARVQRLGDAHFRLELRDVYNFVDSYQYGVLEGAMRVLGHEPEILVRRLSRSCDADFDIRWT